MNITENETRKATKEQSKISALRIQGLSQSEIATKLNLNVNTVKSWCRRHPVESRSICLYCGTSIKQNPNRKEKKFCSDKCRNSWWTEHPEKRTIKKAYHHKCRNCGTEFDNNRPRSIYCSRLCYGMARRREKSHD